MPQTVLTYTERKKAQDELSPIVLRPMQGLSLQLDFINRSPSSWQQLDNFDLYVPGSLRKVLPPSVYMNAIPGVIILEVQEYRHLDSSPIQLIGFGSDGKLYNLPQGTVAGDTGFGPTVVVPYMAQVSYVQIPYEFINWMKLTAVSLGDAVVQYVQDGTAHIFSVTTAGNTGAQGPIWTAGGTVADGSVVWTDQGWRDSPTLFKVNYLSIVAQGQQPCKFDGTVVTPVGVTAPQVQVGVSNIKTTPNGIKGIPCGAGYNYQWTYFNPSTLHESSPSPLVGSVIFYDNSLPGFRQAYGDHLPVLPVDTFYSQMFLGIPATSFPPLLGAGYTHVRFYRSQDGSATLFLLTTLNDGNANGSGTPTILTDANGAVAISDLVPIQDYLPIPTTQNGPIEMLGAYDGYDNGRGLSTQDQGAGVGAGADDLLLQGLTAQAVTSITPGTVADGESGAEFDGVSGFLTSAAAYAGGVGGGLGGTFSFLVRVRTQSDIGGTLIAVMDTQIGPETVPPLVPLYIYLGDDGFVYVTYGNFVVGNVFLKSTVVVNDGANHNIVFTSGPGGTELYVDGTAAVHNVNPVSGGDFAYFIRAGSSDILTRGFRTHTSSPFYNGVMDKIGYWQNVVLSVGNVATILAAAAAGPGFDAAILALLPSGYWNLDDLAHPTVPQSNAALVTPAPLYGANNPPPIAYLGSIYQASQFIVDFNDRVRVVYSNLQDFQSYGQLAQFFLETDDDDPIVCLVTSSDRLILGKSRSIFQIYGNDPSAFQPFAIDTQHGVIAQRGVFATGGSVFALSQEGILVISLGYEFLENLAKLGFRPDMFIGRDIQPYTQQIPLTTLPVMPCITIDRNQSQLLFAIPIGGVPGPPGAGYNNAVLMYLLGPENPGWARHLPPPAVGYVTIRSVKLSSGAIVVLACGSDGNVYRLWGGTGASVATALSQPLPTPDMLPPQTWNTQKIFREMFLEGADLANFTVSASIDGSAFVPLCGPAVGVQTRKRNRIDMTGKEIVLQFVHDQVPVNTPLLSYVRLDYDIEGESDDNA